MRRMENAVITFVDIYKSFIETTYFILYKLIIYNIQKLIKKLINLIVYIDNELRWNV